MNHRGLVLRSASISRVLVLSLIFLSRTLVNPYDTSSVLDSPCLSSSPISNSYHHSLTWPSIAAAVESSIVWDSVHFVRIAQCGYEYEQSYAFLPLLPMAISILSFTVFAPLAPLIGKRAVLGLSGYVINNIAFLFSAQYFYRISEIILKDKDAALRASILFCFNPASIFYSTIYSESLYSLFYLGGIYHLLLDSNNGAMLYFSLSAFARSNGILNAGYFVYQILCNVIKVFIVRRNFSFAVKVGIAGGLRCLCIFIPFIGFQMYGYYNLCFNNGDNIERPWCKAIPPLLYNYIQSHYWNVGFLRYMQAKQIPNFILASPILLLSICTVVHYFKSLPGTAAYFGSPTYCSNNIKKPLPSPKSHRENVRRRRKGEGGKEEDGLCWEEKKERGWANSDGLPFVVHLAVMGTTAFLFMHVQVATRFLSSSLPIYWFSCYRRRKLAYFIWVYFLFYFLFGTFLFSNFYPFT